MIRKKNSAQRKTSTNKILGRAAAPKAVSGKRTFLAGQNRTANGPFSKRSARRHPLGTGKKTKNVPNRISSEQDIGWLLKNAKTEGRTYRNQQHATTEQLHSVLEAVYLLRTKCLSCPDARKIFRDSYKKLARWPKKGTNPLYSYVRYALPPDKNNKSNAHRYAAALRAARDEGVEPGKLQTFLKENGGVTGCAKLDFEKYGSSSNTREAAAQTKMESFLKNASIANIADLRSKMNEGEYASALIFKRGHDVLVLSVRPEKISAALRYPSS